MKKKNPTIAAVLGFFVYGLLYTEITKRCAIAIIGLTIISWALVSFISPTVGLVANIAGAYIGRMWALENNAKIDAQSEQLPEEA